MMKQLLLFVFIVFVGCSKKDNQILSSEKAISSVVIKKSDNPGLQADITGIVLPDSIKFEFPANVAINHLIPTIGFSGIKIEPANRTPQDFTNGIRYKITAADGTTSTYFFQANRTSSDTSTLILGTWKVIKDSVTNNNWSTPSGGYLIPGVYYGNALDFWKFESNGVFSARENNVTGTTTYSIQSGKYLDIPIWTMQYGLGTIDKFTSTSFSVYFSASNAYGGQYFRKVYLER